MDILTAARELFVSKGFRETTLDEIAHHAEFGKGTIYNYFASKEELFIGIVQHAIDEMMALARDAMAAEGTTREKFVRYAREMITYIRDSGELLHAVYHELNRADSTVNASRLHVMMNNARASWGALAAPLAADMESGLLRRCDPMQLIILFDGMLRGYCFHQFSVRKSTADEEIAAAAELITSVFFDGIVASTHKG